MHNECWIFIRDNAVDNSLQAIAPVNMIYSIKYMEYLNTFRTTIECEQKAKRKFNSYTCTCTQAHFCLLSSFLCLACAHARTHSFSHFLFLSRLLTNQKFVIVCKAYSKWCQTQNSNNITALFFLIRRMLLQYCASKAIERTINNK